MGTAACFPPAASCRGSPRCQPRPQLGPAGAGEAQSRQASPWQGRKASPQSPGPSFRGWAAGEDVHSSPWGQDRHVRRLQGSLCPSDEPDLIAALRDAGVLVNGHDVGFPEHGVCGAQELPEETDLPQNRLLGGYPVENPTGKGTTSANRAASCRTSPRPRSPIPLPTGASQQPRGEPREHGWRWGHLVITRSGALSVMWISGSMGMGGFCWNCPGR